MDVQESALAAQSFHARLMAVRLDGGWLPETVLAILVLLVILLLPWGISRHQRPVNVHHPGKARTRSPWRILLIQAISALVGGIIGTLVTWLLSDVFVTFGVQLGRLVIIQVGLGFAALGYAIGSLFVIPGARKILAALLVIDSLLSTALQVSAVYGQYPTIGSLVGAREYQQAPTTTLSGIRDAMHANQKLPTGERMTVSLWQRLAQTGHTPSHPRTGKTMSVAIPATRSRFHAREAVMYLPPAAFSPRPPALPIIIFMSGQPGSPEHNFDGGKINQVAEAYQKRHHGLAPIIVSPDQLGNDWHNTLCVDSPVYGKAETYLRDDVTDWVRRSLPVQSNVKSWTIGGFSMGGTCATQLGPTYPHLYGNIISVGGELHPTNGTVPQMIKRFFHGSRAAYEAHVPSIAIRQHAPSSQEIFFAAGQYDALSQRNARTIAQAARKAGMRVGSILVQGHGHDWHTVRDALTVILPQLCHEAGIGSVSEIRPLSDYPGLTPITGVDTSTDPLAVGASSVGDEK